MFKDLLTKQLNDLGYLGIKVPRTNIKPLKILSKKDLFNNYEFISTDLKSLMIQKSECPLPRIKSFKTATFSNEISIEYELGLDISFLESVLKLLGLPEVNFKTSFKNIRKISYSFENVTGKEVELNKLDMFLTHSDPKNAGPTTKENLEKDRTCVITSVLYSNTINIKAYDKNNASIDLNIPVIKDLLGANANINVVSSNNGEIHFSNKDQSCAFALKAVRLFYNDLTYTCYESVSHGTVKGIKLPDSNVKWLTTDENITILE